MKTIRPNNLNELLDFNKSIRMDGVAPYLAFFRGQVYDWPITPNITRNKNLSNEEILEKEKLFFSNFTEKKLGLKVLTHFKSKNTKFAQLWHNLFQAQHLGFYTRLTDWTQDFISAMFFAIDDETKSNINKNGVIYFYACPYYGNQLINFQRNEDFIFFNQNPFELDKAYLVKHYSQFPPDFENYAGEIRKFRQDGSFIISTTPEINQPIEDIPYINQYLTKIIITPSIKKEIDGYIDDGFKKYIYFASNENNEKESERIREITSKSNNNLYWK